MKITGVSTALVFEKLSGVTFTTLQQIVDQLQNGSYKNKEGSLNNDIAFIDLEKYAESQQEHPSFNLMLNNDRTQVAISQQGHPLAFEKYLDAINEADRIKLWDILGSLNEIVLELDKFEKEILVKYNK